MNGQIPPASAIGSDMNGSRKATTALAYDSPILWSPWRNSSLIRPSARPNALTCSVHVGLFVSSTASDCPNVRTSGMLTSSRREGSRTWFVHAARASPNLSSPFPARFSEFFDTGLS